MKNRSTTLKFPFENQSLICQKCQLSFFFRYNRFVIIRSSWLLMKCMKNAQEIFNFYLLFTSDIIFDSTNCLFDSSAHDVEIQFCFYWLHLLVSAGISFRLWSINNANDGGRWKWEHTHRQSVRQLSATIYGLSNGANTAISLCFSFDFYPLLTHTHTNGNVLHFSIRVSVVLNVNSNVLVLLLKDKNTHF